MPRRLSILVPIETAKQIKFEIFFNSLISKRYFCNFESHNTKIKINNK